MALRDFGSRVATALLRDFRPTASVLRPRASRNASTEASPEIYELEPSSSLMAPPPSEDIIKSWDPVERSRSRKEQLPPSRYKYRSPKYYRGPLHPHQPPPPSNPSSRLFVPGPFSLPRLEQTYTSTIAPDLMTLMYTHFPPGYEAPKPGPRLRPWIGDSPYFKNRPLRGPRGGDNLRLLRKPITFRNVPKLEGVTVHAMVSGAMEDSAYLHVAGMVLQSITNVRAVAHKARRSVAQFGLRSGKYVSVTAELKGDDMYHFISKLVELVLPKIKEYKGIRGTSGDNSGNIGLGLTPDAVAMFPEIEVNYDMYPAKMIPGCHIFIKTSARTDRDARMLLGAVGFPFYGKLVN